VLIGGIAVFVRSPTYHSPTLIISMYVAVVATSEFPRTCAATAMCIAGMARSTLSFSFVAMEVLAADSLARESAPRSQGQQNVAHDDE